MIVLIPVGVVLLGFLFWLYFKGSESEKAAFFKDVKAKIFGFALDLILKAEQFYGNGTGQFKKAFVIDRILNCEFYKGLPLFAQKLLTYEVLSGIIDTLCETVFKNAQKSNAALQNLLK